MDSESGGGWDVAASAFVQTVPPLDEQVGSLTEGVSFALPKARAVRQSNDWDSCRSKTRTLVNNSQ